MESCTLVAGYWMSGVGSRGGILHIHTSNSAGYKQKSQDTLVAGYWMSGVGGGGGILHIHTSNSAGYKQKLQDTLAG